MAVTLGTAIGFESDAPADAEYEVTGYIHDGNNVLVIGSRLPKESALRRDPKLLLTEMRVGRLKLLPAKVEKPKTAAPAASMTAAAKPSRAHSSKKR